MQLAVNLPVEYIPSSKEAVHNPIVDQICMQSQNIHNLSRIMRENLHKAWAVYYVYSDLAQKHLMRSFKNYREKYGKVNIQKNEMKALELFHYHPNLVFFFLNDWDAIIRAISEIKYRIPINECDLGKSFASQALKYKLYLPLKFKQWLDIRKCDYKSQQHLGPYKYCTTDRYTYMHGGRSYGKRIIGGLNGTCRSWEDYSYEIKYAYLNLTSHINQDNPSVFFSHFYDYLNKRIRDQIYHYYIPVMGWGYWKMSQWTQTHEAEWPCLHYKQDPDPTSHWPYCAEYGPTELRELREPIVHNQMIPDNTAFINANNELWGIHLKKFYKAIIEDFIETDVFKNWMRAWLAFDTIARGAYGKAMDFHPRFISLKTYSRKFICYESTGYTFL